MTGLAKVRAVVVAASAVGLLAVGAADAWGAAGDLDPLFGNSGHVFTGFAGSSSVALGLAIQPNAAIVAVGDVDVGFANWTDWALARYTPRGALDRSFGVGGKVTTNPGGTCEGCSIDHLLAAAIQVDGKIVAVGDANAGCCSDPSAGVARYEPDGSLDQGFGSGGFSLVVPPNAFGAGFNSVALQPDGSILAAGYSEFGLPTEFLTARYLPDGTLDPSFGSGGLVEDATLAGRASAVLLQPDGRILVAGWTNTGFTANTVFTAVRYLADGSRDSSFGKNGVATVSFGSMGYKFAGATGAVLQDDGRLVMAGRASATTGDRLEAAALARLLPTGKLDPTFGVQGRVVQDFGDPSRRHLVNAVSLAADGDIVIGGDLVEPAGSSQVEVARFLPDGSADPSFGTGGRVVTSFGGSSQFATSLAMQTDGKIVVGGDVVLQKAKFLLARYLPS